jgi:hypothetical protein
MAAGAGEEDITNPFVGIGHSLQQVTHDTPVKKEIDVTNVTFESMGKSSIRKRG